MQQAQAGTGVNLVMGLPVGMGRRFAVDPDNDGLFRQDEAQRGTDPRDPDSDVQECAGRPVTRLSCIQENNRTRQEELRDRMEGIDIPSIDVPTLDLPDLPEVQVPDAPAQPTP